jgi:hypothetical protein
MTPMEYPPAAAALNEAQTMRPAASRGVLDPVSRASEILFGLIMVLTFTLSLAATEAGRADVRAVTGERAAHDRSLLLDGSSP